MSATLRFAVLCCVLPIALAVALHRPAEPADEICGVAVTPDGCAYCSWWSVSQGRIVHVECHAHAICNADSHPQRSMEWVQEFARFVDVDEYTQQRPKETP